PKPRRSSARRDSRDARTHQIPETRSPPPTPSPPRLAFLLRGRRSDRAQPRRPRRAARDRFSDADEKREYRGVFAAEEAAVAPHPPSRSRHLRSPSETKPPIRSRRLTPSPRRNATATRPRQASAPQRPKLPQRRRCGTPRFHP